MGRTNKRANQIKVLANSKRNSSCKFIRVKDYTYKCVLAANHATGREIKLKSAIISNLKRDKESLLSSKSGLVNENEVLKGENQLLIQEKEEMKRENQLLIQEKEEMKREMTNLLKEAENFNLTSEVRESKNRKKPQSNRKTFHLLGNMAKRKRITDAIQELNFIASGNANQIDSCSLKEIILKVRFGRIMPMCKSFLYFR